MLSADLLHFLRELALNNHKAWFDENRAWYDRVRTNFIEFTGEVLAGLRKWDTDLEGLEPRQCIFRINRDVRFSKNKLPYKINMAASFDREGKKSVYAGYYVHIEPGNSFIGGGIWMPAAPELKKIRQEIDYNWNAFSQLIGDKKFRKTYNELYNGDDVRLKNLPRGYEQDNPAAEYLKLKSWLAMRQVKDEELTSGSFVKTAISELLVLKPLNRFINQALEP